MHGQPRVKHVSLGMVYLTIRAFASVAYMEIIVLALVVKLGKILDMLYISVFLGFL